MIQIIVKIDNILRKNYGKMIMGDWGFEPGQHAKTAF